jgi:hypothetical protein
MKKLDAYARITADEAARLAVGAIAGIAADRRRRAEKAIEAYRHRASAPRWWRPWRGPERTTVEARQCLNALCRERGRLILDDLEYDYLMAAGLHGDALRGAEALLNAASQDAGGAKLGDRDILINPEDMLELRALAEMAQSTDRPVQAGTC